MRQAETCPNCRAKQEQNEQAARKAELLAHYAGKEPVFFYQFDGFLDMRGDDAMHADQDGDALMGCQVWELRSGGIPVRVQILDGTSKPDATRLLRKIVKWMEDGGATFTAPEPPALHATRDRADIFQRSKESLRKAEAAMEAAQEAIKHTEVFSSAGSADACHSLLAAAMAAIAQEAAGHDRANIPF